MGAIMQLYRDHIVIRTLGSLLGAGFVVVGLYAVFSSGPDVAGDAVERAGAFGVTAMITGVLAIFGSWAEPRVKEIWCARPRTWRRHW